jgi:hypothetical protein
MKASFNPYLLVISVFFFAVSCNKLDLFDPFFLYKALDELTPVNENDFNYTTNPSAVKSGSLGQLNNNVTGSDFMPFATTIGLYNDQGDLLIVGKFGTPYAIPGHSDITFVVKYDI